MFTTVVIFIFTGNLFHNALILVWLEVELIYCIFHQKWFRKIQKRGLVNENKINSIIDT